MKIVTLIVLFCLVSAAGFAKPSESIMALDMRQSGMIYVVVAVIVLVFAGVAAYLFSIDKRLKKIERNK